MLYHSLLPVVLSRVERLAATDTKYADRCRLENYCFMGEALKSLAARLPALQQHWQVWTDRQQGHGVNVCGVVWVRLRVFVRQHGVREREGEGAAHTHLLLPAAGCCLLLSQVAESRRESALSAYVTDQLQYSKLWKLLEFGDRLDGLLKVCWPCVCVCVC